MTVRREAMQKALKAKRDRFYIGFGDWPVKITEEFELVRKSGRTVHVTLSASLVDRGRYMAVLHDLSGRVKEADRLRDSGFVIKDVYRPTRCKRRTCNAA